MILSSYSPSLEQLFERNRKRERRSNITALFATHVHGKGERRDHSEDAEYVHSTSYAFPILNFLIVYLQRDSSDSQLRCK